MRSLAALTTGKPFKINLIPFNEWDGCLYRRPSEERIEGFLAPRRSHGTGRHRAQEPGKRYLSRLRAAQGAPVKPGRRRFTICAIDAEAHACRRLSREEHFSAAQIRRSAPRRSKRRSARHSPGCPCRPSARRTHPPRSSPPGCASRASRRRGRPIRRFRRRPPERGR